MHKRRETGLRQRITARAPVENKTVKSAGRVLEILEYFDDLQLPSTVMDIASALQYPQSSTSALLRSLVSMGYLDYDPYARTYVTSTRVALLGSWRDTQFFAEGAIIAMMKELNASTGDTVVLAVRNGLFVQYIHVIQAISPARLHMTLGTVRPIAASGAGYALLCTLSDAEVTRIIMRINAEAGPDEKLIRTRELLDELAVFRARGYVSTFDLVTNGGGIIAAPLPRMGDQPRMIVGIGGVSQVMREREKEVSSILLTEIKERFGRRASHFVPHLQTRVAEQQAEACA